MFFDPQAGQLASKKSGVRQKRKPDWVDWPDITLQHWTLGNTCGCGERQGRHNSPPTTARPRSARHEQLLTTERFAHFFLLDITDRTLLRGWRNHAMNSQTFSWNLTLWTRRASRILADILTVVSAFLQNVQMRPVHQWFNRAVTNFYQIYSSEHISYLCTNQTNDQRQFFFAKMGTHYLFRFFTTNTFRDFVGIFASSKRITCLFLFRYLLSIKSSECQEDRLCSKTSETKRTFDCSKSYKSFCGYYSLTSSYHNFTKLFYKATLKGCNLGSGRSIYKHVSFFFYTVVHSQVAITINATSTEQKSSRRNTTGFDCSFSAS